MKQDLDKKKKVLDEIEKWAMEEMGKGFAPKKKKDDEDDDEEKKRKADLTIVIG